MAPSWQAAAHLAKYEESRSDFYDEVQRALMKIEIAGVFMGPSGLVMSNTAGLINSAIYFARGHAVSGWIGVAFNILPVLRLAKTLGVRTVQAGAGLVGAGGRAGRTLMRSLLREGAERSPATTRAAAKLLRCAKRRQNRLFCRGNRCSLFGRRQRAVVRSVGGTILLVGLTAFTVGKRRRDDEPDEDEGAVEVDDAEKDQNDDSGPRRDNAWEAIFGDEETISRHDEKELVMSDLPRAGDASFERLCDQLFAEEFGDDGNGPPSDAISIRSTAPTILSTPPPTEAPGQAANPRVLPAASCTTVDARAKSRRDRCRNKGGRGRFWGSRRTAALHSDFSAQTKTSRISHSFSATPRLS